MKQFLINLQQSTNINFIVDILDAKHILIDPNQRKWVEQEVEKMIEKNIYTAEGAE